MSYHKRIIEKGVYGYASKIREELEEFEDAVQQGNKIMALTELSDLIGAIKGYLLTHHPDIDISDLLIMATATERAFLSGHRK